VSDREVPGDRRRLRWVGSALDPVWLPVAWQQEAVASEPGCRALPYFDTVLAFWRDFWRPWWQSTELYKSDSQSHRSEHWSATQGCLGAVTINPKWLDSCSWSIFLCGVCMFSLHILAKEFKFGLNVWLRFNILFNNGQHHFNDNPFCIITY
jgi:hypothetical protein